MLWVDANTGDYKLDKDTMIVFFCKMRMFSMHIPYLFYDLTHLSDTILEENHFILIDSQITSQNLV